MMATVVSAKCVRWFTQNGQVATQPGVEPTTSWSHVQQPKIHLYMLNNEEKTMSVGQMSPHYAAVQSI